MLAGVCIGTNDIESAGKFYDAVLETIGMHCVFSDPKEKGYAGADGRVTLFLNEGKPGPRDYHPQYYGAYVRDLDGNKLNVSIRIERA